MSRAFDSVSHRILLQKMAGLSMPKHILRCMASYLVNRKYTLKVDGEPTKFSHIATSSVPQGSHVGPIMYVLFCKDIELCTEGTNCKLVSFADDTKFLRVIRTIEDMYELQLVIDRAVEWSRVNKISINPTKTIQMTYAKTVYRNFTTLYYFIGTQEIQTKDQIRDLGMVFDSKMSFIPHAREVEVRTKAMRGAAHRFAMDIDSRVSVLTVVQVYVRPIIEYGSII